MGGNMVIYQFSNLPQIFFVVLFAMLILVDIIICLVCFPILKLDCQLIFSSEARHKHCNSVKAVIALSLIVILIYSLCVTFFILGVNNILDYTCKLRNTNIEKCDTVTGRIESLELTPQYSRGANLVSYHISFMLENTVYYINTDVGVTLETIDEWNIGNCVTVYYQTNGDINEVIKVEKNP